MVLDLLDSRRARSNQGNQVMATQSGALRGSTQLHRNHNHRGLFSSAPWHQIAVQTRNATSRIPPSPHPPRRSCSEKLEPKPADDCRETARRLSVLAVQGALARSSASPQRHWRTQRDCDRGPPCAAALLDATPPPVLHRFRGCQVSTRNNLNAGRRRQSLDDYMNEPDNPFVCTRHDARPATFVLLLLHLTLAFLALHRTLPHTRSCP